MRRPHSLADWLRALEASGWKGRKAGREHVGPCPLCGGADRFHVGPGRKAAVLAGCRHGCTFEALADAVFGDRGASRLPDWPRTRTNGRYAASVARSCEFARSGPIRPPATESEAHRATESAYLGAGKGRIPPDSGPSRAARLWAEARPVPPRESHPARRWAARRHLWPDGDPWPDAVRWRSSQERGETRALASWAGPMVGGGSLVACFAPIADWTGPAPAPSGVQLVHVGPEGRPREDRGGLAKRSLGTMAAAVCAVGDPLPLAGRLHIVEGVADGLAVAARCDGAVIATGGTAGLARLADPLAALCAPVTLWPDGDSAGREAAARLAGQLRRGGIVVHVAPVPDGEDPASMAGPRNTWRQAK